MRVCVSNLKIFCVFADAGEAETVLCHVVQLTPHLSKRLFEAKQETRLTQWRKTKTTLLSRENATAAEANRTLEEAEVQEIERRSMKSSSTVANQRGVPHRRQDGWTSTPCVSDDIRKDREYDKTAGERLPEQLAHSIEKKVKMKQEHKKSKEEARRAAE